MIVIIKTNERIIVNINERKNCCNKDLVSLTWNDALNAEISEFIPFVEKYNANRNPSDNNPLLRFFMMSSIAILVASLVEAGKTVSINSIKVS